MIRYLKITLDSWRKLMPRPAKTDKLAAVKKTKPAQVAALNPLSRKSNIQDALQSSEERFRCLFENMMNAIAIYRVENNGEDFIFVDFNQAAEALENMKRDDVIGRNVVDVFPGVVQFGILDVFRRVYATGKPENFPVTFYKDERITGWRDNYIYKLPSGEIVAVYSDQTEKKQQEELIRKQAEEIINVSTPVLKIWDGVIAAPIIGSLESNRTQQFMENFLNRIVENNATVGLIDITGVPIIDTQTAQHLIETFTAAKLLGTRVIVTGIRPAIAQTLIQLGIDLSGIDTCVSLSAGLERALACRGLKVAGQEQPVQR